jgi:hypothetical protein
MQLPLQHSLSKWHAPPFGRQVPLPPSTFGKQHETPTPPQAKRLSR